MAWIESHQSLGEHPKTKKLCRVLDISKREAVGTLHLLWWWALDYAQDGSLNRYEPMDIAIGAEWDGDEREFVDALVSSGFLESTPDGLAIHDWDDYAGKLIERRERNAQRMREARAHHDGERAEHVQRTQRARVQLQNQPNQPNQPTNPPQSPQGDGVERQFDSEFWPNYPKGRGSRADALKIWRKLPDQDRAAAAAALPAFQAGRDWRSGFHKAPEVWLRGRCWENPPPPDEGDAPRSSRASPPLLQPGSVPDDGGLSDWIRSRNGVRTPHAIDSGRGS